MGKILFKRAPQVKFICEILNIVYQLLRESQSMLKTQWSLAFPKHFLLLNQFFQIIKQGDLQTKFNNEKNQGNHE